MAADMVPMYVRCYGGNGLCRQRRHRLPYVADSQSGIYQQAALFALKQIAVRLFPVPVFAYYMRITADGIYCKPIFHCVHHI